jgi:hypothetical protein
MRRFSKTETDWSMNPCLITLCLPILGATLFASSAQAQRHVAFAPAPASRTFVSPGAGTRARFVHPRHARRFFAGSAYAPYFYSDDDSGPGMIEPPPQITVVQPTSPVPAPNPPESLLLELQGDHWVRITNYGQSQIGGPSIQPEPERATNLPSAVSSRHTQTAEPPSQLPPAVLVFRDAHQEEIGEYVIVGTIIYTGADYWSSGSWTRRVPIVELDVPATLKLNRERGAKFSLPSGPNEVMMRP